MVRLRKRARLQMRPTLTSLSTASKRAPAAASAMTGIKSATREAIAASPRKRTSTLRKRSRRGARAKTRRAKTPAKTLMLRRAREMVAIEARAEAAVAATIRDANATIIETTPKMSLERPLAVKDRRKLPLVRLTTTRATYVTTTRTMSTRKTGMRTGTHQEAAVIAEVVAADAVAAITTASAKIARDKMPLLMAVLQLVAVVAAVEDATTMKIAKIAATQAPSVRTLAKAIAAVADSVEAARIAASSPTEVVAAASQGIISKTARREKPDRVREEAAAARMLVVKTTDKKSATRTM